MTSEVALPSATLYRTAMQLIVSIRLLRTHDQHNDGKCPFASIDNEEGAAEKWGQMGRPPHPQTYSGTTLHSSHCISKIALEQLYPSVLMFRFDVNG